MNLIIATPLRGPDGLIYVGSRVIPPEAFPAHMVMPIELYTVVQIDERFKVHLTTPELTRFRVETHYRGTLLADKYVRLHGHRSFSAVGNVYGAKIGDTGWVDHDRFLPDYLIESLLK